MGLGIYTSTIPGAKLSAGGTFTNPLPVSTDGRTGGVLEQRLYLRNDDALFYFTTVTVQPVDTINPSTVAGSGATAGYSWKVKAGNNQPTEAEWTATTAGASISLSNVGAALTPDTSTYQPFWVRIEIPKNVDIATFTDVQLRILSNKISV